MIRDKFFKIDLYHLEKYYNLINKDLANALKYIEWDKIDTIIMDETIEHITEDDFEYFLLEVRRNF